MFVFFFIHLFIYTCSDILPICLFVHDILSVCLFVIVLICFLFVHFLYTCSDILSICLFIHILIYYLFVYLYMFWYITFLLFFEFFWVFPFFSKFSRFFLFFNHFITRESGCKWSLVFFFYHVIICGCMCVSQYLFSRAPCKSEWIMWIIMKLFFPRSGSE